MALFKEITFTILLAIIFFIAIVVQIPVYYMLVHEYVPNLVIFACGGLIIGSIIAASVVGYIYKYLSSFAIFSIVMLMIFIGFYASATIIYLHKKIKN